MPHKSKSKSGAKLAFFRNPDGSRAIVLVRTYGAVTAVVLDDQNLDDNSVIRLHTAVVSEFVEPYCEGLVDPSLSQQYDEIQLFLTEGGLAVLGPLTSARAARYIKDDAISAQKAIERARQEGLALTAQQAARTSMIVDEGLGRIRG